MGPRLSPIMHDQTWTMEYKLGTYLCSTKCLVKIITELKEGLKIQRGEGASINNLPPGWNRVN